MTDVDVVVVGSGSAGSPLAARLSEVPDRRVLVIEAGPVARAATEFAPEILSVADKSASVPGHPNNWSFPARLTPSRPWAIPRGKVFGGCSAINGGYFVRGTAHDFEAWAPAGTWSLPSVLPFFKRLETDHDVRNDLHGTSGPVPVQRAAGSLLSPVAEAFVAACREAGFPEEVDKNGFGPPGVGLVPGNVRDGIRVNTAMSHLLPHLDRPNLTVWGGVFVRRVVFRRSRALGVEIEAGDGETRVIRAGEVVLAAGAVKSAHLLLLSGIGPADELRSVGVPVVQDLPGVGKDWVDHPHVMVRFQAARPVPFHPHMLPPQAMLNYDSGGHAAGDIELLCYAAPFERLLDGTSVGASRDGHAGLAWDRPQMSILCALQQPASRGTLSLRSVDPHDPPDIAFNYLEHPGDARRLWEAVEQCRDVLARPSLRPWVDRVTEPGFSGGAREARRWVEQHLGSAIHMAGTAAMGRSPDEGAVVDEYLRVFGVDGLRVADTSIVPVVLHRGPSATAVMIGERAAAFWDPPHAPAATSTQDPRAKSR